MPGAAESGGQAYHTAGLSREREKPADPTGFVLLRRIHLPILQQVQDERTNTRNPVSRPPQPLAGTNTPHQNQTQKILSILSIHV